MGSIRDNAVPGIGADTDIPDADLGNPRLHGAGTQARCKDCSMILFQGRCIDCGPTETHGAQSAEEPPPAKKARLTAACFGGGDMDFDDIVAQAEAFDDEAARAQAGEEDGPDDYDDELFQVFG